jgi:aspartate/glutamate racemase
MQQVGDWVGAGALLGEAARGLQRVGASAIVLATNTTTSRFHRSIRPRSMLRRPSRLHCLIVSRLPFR